MPLSHSVPPLPGVRRLSLLSYCAGAVVGVGATAAAFGAGAAAASPVVQVGALGLGAAALVGLGWGVSSRAGQVDRDLRSAVRGLEVAAAKVDQALTGLASGLHEYPPPFTLEEPSLARLADQIERLQGLSQQLREAAASPPEPAAPVEVPGQIRSPRDHVAILVNLARRLQVRIHGSILEIEELERHAEDPHLMKALYGLDHDLTILRRWVENLVILGGSPPHRQWTRPVRLGDVARAAIAEVEKFTRVTLVPPLEEATSDAAGARPPMLKAHAVTLKGHAVADVNHLLADLIENATNFSKPATQVEVHTSVVRAGVAVEIVDRGLGFNRRSDLDQVNALLKDPKAADFEALLMSGRIGLYVVSVLARKHDIAVELHSNVFGGTTAVVILPHALIGEEPYRDAPAAQPQQAATVPALEWAAAPVAQDDASAARHRVREGDRPALPQRTARHRDRQDDQPWAGRTASENTADPELWQTWQSGLNGTDLTTRNHQES